MASPVPFSRVILLFLGLTATAHALPAKSKPTLKDRSPQILGPPISSFTPGDPNRSSPSPPAFGFPPGLVFGNPSNGAGDRAGSGSSDPAPPSTDGCDWTRGPCILSPTPTPPQSSAPPSDEWDGDSDKRKKKRQGAKTSFNLPPDGSQDFKDALVQLEHRLEWLQNKQFKTDADWDEIQDLKDILRQVAGITGISAPSGSSSTFTIG